MLQGAHAADAPGSGNPPATNCQTSGLWTKLLFFAELLGLPYLITKLTAALLAGPVVAGAGAGGGAGARDGSLYPSSSPAAALPGTMLLPPPRLMVHFKAGLGGPDCGRKSKLYLVPPRAHLQNLKPQCGVVWVCRPQGEPQRIAPTNSCALRACLWPRDAVSPHICGPLLCSNLTAAREGFTQFSHRHTIYGDSTVFPYLSRRGACFYKLGRSRRGRGLSRDPAGRHCQGACAPGWCCQNRLVFPTSAASLDCSSPNQ